MHALIKELAILRVEHLAEIHSNESQHLSAGTEVVRLWRRFSFVRQQALSFRTRRHHLCRQGMAFACLRQLRLQRPVSAPAHRTKGITRSKGREGVNEVGGGIGVGGGSGDVNVDGDGDGAGRRTVMEVKE